MQAAAAGIEPEARDEPGAAQARRRPRAARSSCSGRPSARSTRALLPRRSGRSCAEPVLDALADLRAALRRGRSARARAARPRSTCAATDLANMGLARRGRPARAASSATSTAAACSRACSARSPCSTPADQRAASPAFVVNKFRGDPALLAPGLDMLRALTGRPVARRAAVAARACGSTPRTRSRSTRRALAGRRRRSARRARRRRGAAAADLQRHRRRRARRASRAWRCGSRAEPRRRRRAPTSSSCPAPRPPSTTWRWLRDARPGRRDARRAAQGGPVLGICGGYQMLGERIDDDGRERRGRGRRPRAAAGRDRASQPTRLLRRRAGRGDRLGGAAATGYEIRHGRPAPSTAASRS